MSNDNDKVLARLWKLWAMICKMIMDGKRNAKTVADVLQKIVSESSERKFADWRTIIVGGGPKTSSDFFGLLSAHHYQIDDAAGELLSSPDFTVCCRKVRYNLVIVSVADLGFETRTLYREIFLRAQELGLRLCRSEIGPQLRDDHDFQHEGDLLFVGMEPLICKDGFPRIFGLSCRDGRRALEGFYCQEDQDGFDPNHHFVFTNGHCVL